MMTTEEVQLTRTGFEVLLRPLATIIEKVTGRSAEEVGEGLATEIRVRRLKREVELYQRVKQLTIDAGLDPKRVVDKLLFPLLAGATLEDDAGLKEKWAALLANAATDKAPVLPAFAKTLAEMTPQEALLLDRLCTSPTGATTAFDRNRLMTQEEFTDLAAACGIEMSQKDILVDDLVRMGLLANLPGGGVLDTPITIVGTRFYITDFGSAFYRACQPPAAQKQF